MTHTPRFDDADLPLFNDDGSPMLSDDGCCCDEDYVDCENSPTDGGTLEIVENGVGLGTFSGDPNAADLDFVASLIDQVPPGYYVYKIDIRAGNSPPCAGTGGDSFSHWVFDQLSAPANQIATSGFLTPETTVETLTAESVIVESMFAQVVAVRFWLDLIEGEGEICEVYQSQIYALGCRKIYLYDMLAGDPCGADGQEAWACASQLADMPSSITLNLAGFATSGTFGACDFNEAYVLPLDTFCGAGSKPELEYRSVALDECESGGHTYTLHAVVKLRLWYGGIDISDLNQHIIGIDGGPSFIGNVFFGLTGQVWSGCSGSFDYGHEDNAEGIYIEWDEVSIEW